MQLLHLRQSVRWSVDFSSTEFSFENSLFLGLKIKVLTFLYPIPILTMRMFHGSMFFYYFFSSNIKKILLTWTSWRHLILSTSPFFTPFLEFSETTSCMLPCKCHTYLKSLWSLLFVGISQHDAMYKKVEENWVSIPKPDFCNFLTVSDIFQRNARNLIKSYPNKLPNAQNDSGCPK